MSFCHGKKLIFIYSLRDLYMFTTMTFTRRSNRPPHLYCCYLLLCWPPFSITLSFPLSWFHSRTFSYSPSPFLYCILLFSLAFSFSSLSLFSLCFSHSLFTPSVSLTFTVFISSYLFFTICLLRLGVANLDNSFSSCTKEKSKQAILGLLGLLHPHSLIK